MEVVPDDRMLFFFCIDYTIWPGKMFLTFVLCGCEPKETALKNFIFISLVAKYSMTTDLTLNFLLWNIVHPWEGLSRGPDPSKI